MANVLNLAEVASDDVGALEDRDPVVVLMIQTPGYC
jgi:hypothetical protein